jgi:hypothetical protein
MTSEFVHYADLSALEAQRRALDTAYMAEQRAARGLPDGASLDRTPDGRTVAPITTGCTVVITDPAAPGALLLYHEVHERYVGDVVKVPTGDVVIAKADKKPPEALPKQWRDVLDKTTRTQEPTNDPAPRDPAAPAGRR